MRTTLTLDADVAALLRRAQARRKEPMRKIVNDALREGLSLMMLPPRKREAPFRTQSVDLGPCLLGSLDNIAEVLAAAEGETFR
jgi:hypothetical protein